MLYNNFKKEDFFSKRQGGQAVLIFALFFIFIISSISLSFTNAVLRQFSTNDADVVDSRSSITVAEVGGEDAYYRLLTNKNIVSPTYFMLNSNTVDTTVTDVNANEKTITSVGASSGNNRVRKNEIKIIRGVGASFHYGVQMGAGGINLQNSSSIDGNVYASGTITGTGSNSVTGDVISAGATGSISGVHLSGNAYAHNISNSIIDQDAYYQSIGTSTVSGVATCAGNSHCHPGSVDQPTVPLPMTDAMITALENVAIAGGSETCAGGPSGTYSISSNITIGPRVIPCNLSITAGTVTLTGPILVQGNVTISNSATVIVSASNMDASMAVIAHGSNVSTSSKITLSNNATFLGQNSNPNFKTSYVVFISQNSNGEGGGSTDAINIQNSVSGDILAYAIHGNLTIQNSANVTAVTAYKTIAKNNIVVNYNKGLVSTLFSTGPSGAWQIKSWKEIK